MELRQYLALLRRWWWLIAVMALVGGAAASAAALLRTPTYEASTTVLINQAPGSLPNAEDVLSGQRVAATYAELLHQRPVLEEVIANLKLNTDPESLGKRVRITPVRDTNLLVLTVQDANSVQAANIANEMVRVFIEQNLQFQASRYAASLESLQAEMDNVQADIDSTEGRIKNLEHATAPAQITERTQLETLLTQQRSNYATLLDRYEEVRLAQAQTTDKVSVVEEAQPGERAGQSNLIIGVQGVVVGVFVAVGVVLLIEYLRDTMKSAEEIEQVSGVPTLGVIGSIQATDSPHMLVTADKPRSPNAEAYRLLRANIEFAGVDNPIRTLVITSSGPAEGKTTTASNLAIAAAQSGKRVILVDADLRRPTLHKLFEQPNTRGITTALLQGQRGMIGDHVVATGIENLFLMPSGPLPPNPAELLGSQRMADVAMDLKTHADIVIFDSPPVLVVADTILVSRVCDATLVVILAESTRGDALKRAKSQIEQAGARLIGVVLNRVSASSDGYYHYYYQKYYSSKEE